MESLINAIEQLPPKVHRFAKFFAIFLLVVVFSLLVFIIVSLSEYMDIRWAMAIVVIPTLCYISIYAAGIMIAIRSIIQNKIPSDLKRLFKQVTEYNQIFEQNGDINLLYKITNIWKKVFSHPAFKRWSEEEQFQYYNMAGQTYVELYENTGVVQHLHTGLRFLEIIPSNINLTSDEYLTNRYNYSVGLHKRYNLLKNRVDLDEALQIARFVLENTPTDSPDWPLYSTGLGNYLITIYKITRDEKLLDESIAVYRVAQKSSHAKLPGYAHNLANSLYLKQTKTTSGSDLVSLDETIRLLQQSLSKLSVDSHLMPSTLQSLGNSFRLRHDINNLEDDFNNAQGYYRQACSVAEKQSSPLLLHISINWGKWAFEREEWEVSCEAFQYALHAFRNLFYIQLSQSGKEYWIGFANDVFHQMTYALIRLGKLKQALETIEMTRARMLGESMERSRRDLSFLSDLGYGDLLERFEKVNGLLEKKTQDMFSDTELNIQIDWTKQLVDAQKEMQIIVADIRNIPGYETFLISPSCLVIQELASTAPLVYIFATKNGGSALIVTSEAVQLVDLPSLYDYRVDFQVASTFNMLSEYASGSFPPELLLQGTTYMDKYLEIHNRDDYNGKLDAWKNSLDETTSWLWDIAMLPIISKLKEMKFSGSQVVLIPLGKLALLPLHAAWVSDSSQPCGRQYALDFFAFTYAPSALALMHARSRAKKVKGEKLLVIENPGLFFSGPAAQVALSLFGDSTYLRGEAANFDAVQQAFQNHNILYFLTHGIARFDEPLQSTLNLADKPLTLDDIFAIQTDSVRLAVLAACETGIPSNLDLLDEVISLPSALMQAGVPSVIGSLWMVSDVSTPILMSVFFEQWREGGLSVPLALQKAQIILRDARSDERAMNYIKGLLAKMILSSDSDADKLYNELLIHDFDHPFYWAAFMYIGL